MSDSRFFTAKFFEVHKDFDEEGFDRMGAVIQKYKCVMATSIAAKFAAENLDISYLLNEVASDYGLKPIELPGNFISSVSEETKNKFKENLKNEITSSKILMYIFHEIMSIEKEQDIFSRSKESREIWDEYGKDEQFYLPAFSLEFRKIYIESYLCSLAYRLANKGFINLPSPKSVSISKEIIAYVLPDHPAFLSYILTPEGRIPLITWLSSKSYQEINLEKINLDKVILTYTQLSAWLRLIPETNRKIIMSAFSGRHLRKLITTAEEAESISKLVNSPQFNQILVKILPSNFTFKFDPMLTQDFFKAAEAEEIKVDVPTPNKLEDIKDFLDSEDGKKYIEFNSKLIERLKEWPAKNNLDIDVSNLNKLQNTLSHFKMSNNGFVNENKMPLYREATVLLSGIVNKFDEKSSTPEKAQADLNIRATVLKNLMPGITVCEPGCYTNLHTAYDQLSNNLSVLLMNIRREIASNIISETLLEEKIIHNLNLGMEIHYTNSVLNYYAQELGVKEIEDGYATGVENFDDLYEVTDKKIKPKLQKMLTLEMLVEYIQQEKLESISDIMKDANSSNFNDKSNKILEAMKMFGEDKDFLVSHFMNEDALVMEGKYEAESEKNIYLQTFLTIVQRLSNRGFVNLDHSAKTKLIDNVDLIIWKGFPQHAFVIDRQNKYGAPDKREPLSIFLGKLEEDLEPAVNEIYKSYSTNKNYFLPLANSLPEKAQVILFKKMNSENYFESGLEAMNFVSQLSKESREIFYQNFSLQSLILDYKKSLSKYSQAAACEIIKNMDADFLIKITNDEKIFSSILRLIGESGSKILYDKLGDEHLRKIFFDGQDISVAINCIYLSGGNVVEFCKRFPENYFKLENLTFQNKNYENKSKVIEDFSVITNSMHNFGNDKKYVDAVDAIAKRAKEMIEFYEKNNGSLANMNDFKNLEARILKWTDNEKNPSKASTFYACVRELEEVARTQVSNWCESRLFHRLFQIQKRTGKEMIEQLNKGVEQSETKNTRMHNHYKREVMLSLKEIYENFDDLLEKTKGRSELIDLTSTVIKPKAYEFTPLNQASAANDNVMQPEARLEQVPRRRV